MSLPLVIWASSGLPPVKKKFRFQPYNMGEIITHSLSLYFQY